MKPDIRFGIGYDSHRFAEGRRLILGGLEIPHDRGLLGHSDADVVLHALSDALLGAAGLNDIGSYFPDTDKKYKDIDSAKILIEVLAFVEGKGFLPGNIDIVIIAESPRLAEYIPEMKKKLSEIMHLSEDDISIKATSNEKMGFIGREEGIASIVGLLIYKK
jgi:2-C-methyl-D-erythritol 2,4-cyclodiphosphate synthase